MLCILVMTVLSFYEVALNNVTREAHVTRCLVGGYSLSTFFSDLSTFSGLG